MKKIMLLSLAIVCQISTLMAEIYVLDLQKSIEIAKEKSLDMLSLKQDLKIAGYNLKSTISQLRTHVDLELTTPQYTQGLQKDQDSNGISYYSVNTMNYEGNLTISQPLPTNGNISLTSGISTDDDFQFDQRDMYLNSKLSLTQPLDALYGYNTIKASYKRAKLNYESTQKSLKRAELNLNYNVSNSFYQLLSVQKAQEIARLNLERQQEAFDIADKKYKAGLIKEVDALQMEVDLAEARNNYDLSIINQISAMNSFKELIGIEFQDSVLLNNELKYNIVIVDPTKAVSLALANRLEIREQEIAIELNKLSIKRQKAEGMIQGDLVAYYQRSGYSEQGLDTQVGTVFNNTMADLKSRPQDYGIGLNISIPIIDWGENRALVNAAKAELKQSEYEKQAVKRSIEAEVRNLVDDLNTSLKRLQLLEKNVKVAEKSFDITRQRFSDGDIDSQDLALERDRLNNAYTSHLSAYINYQLMLSDLMRKTFYDFEKNRPLN